ncbi:MAG: hypothetical protein M1820_002723 [Bogoriella megaspora]|nr:MAG: hypothetical protein M1820_002723 [Bogoriella megaspora]
MVGMNWPMLIWVPETFAPKINANITAQANHKGKSEVMPEQTTVGKQKAGVLIQLVLTRPIRILAEPIVLMADLFLGYQYTIVFLYFNAYPIIFKSTYGMTNGQSALMFLPSKFALGAVLAIVIFLLWDHYLKRSKLAGKEWAIKEEYRRLPLACLGGPFFGLSEFWLGWTSRPSVHWIVPSLSGIFLGIGIDLTFIALNNYLTDAYDIYSASALASSVFTRNVLTTVLLPLVTYPLWDNLGTAWGSSLMGFLCLVLTPIPFAFIKWGPELRKRSHFCKQLENMRTNRLEQNRDTCDGQNA